MFLYLCTFNYNYYCRVFYVGRAFFYCINSTYFLLLLRTEPALCKPLMLELLIEGECSNARVGTPIGW